MNGMVIEVMRACARLHRAYPTDGLAIELVNQLAVCMAETHTVDQVYRVYRQLGGALELDAFINGAREYQMAVTGEVESEYESFYSTLFAIEQLASQEFVEVEVL